MDQRAVGVVAIIVKQRAAGAPGVNQVLTEFGDIVLGRMGLPYPARGPEHHHADRGCDDRPDRGAHGTPGNPRRRDGQVDPGQDLKEPNDADNHDEKLERLRHHP